MTDAMVDLWKGVATRFRCQVVEYLEKEDIQEEDRKKLGTIPGVMDNFINATGNPTILYTRDNLVLLVKCWKDFYTWTHGTRYWHKEFPEWSFMISQFQVFVNEYEIKEMMKDKNITRAFLSVIQEGMKGIQEKMRFVDADIEIIKGNMTTTASSIKDLGAKMTTTTSSIEDLQGRVKKLEKPWWPRRAKNKDGSGSGERMVDLLEDLEKLSCSEKREED